jgi:murein DD-endopeptidase MepM/ murein hydrolase activator NlpD
MAIAVAGIGIAAAAPLLGAALAPAAPQLRPIAGAVAGAVDRPPASADPVEPAGTQEARVTARDSTKAGPLVAEERVAPPVATLGGYQWPIRAGRVSLPFKAIPGGEWISNGRLFHDGVDMASFCGAPVGAAHAGVVLAAGRRFDDAIGWVGDLGPYYRRLEASHGWGNLPIVVVVDDGNGYRSIYAHFRDVTVKAGDTVRAGQLIGHEGATGHASGCHVHYGLFSPLETRTFGVRPDIIRRMRVPKLEIARIDPLAVLPGGAVALRTRNIARAIASANLAPVETSVPRYVAPSRST